MFVTMAKGDGYKMIEGSDAFALSFSLFQPNGRRYLFCGCLVVYAASMLFADRKRDLFLASMVFILLRLIWSAVITGLQALHPSGPH